MTTDLNDSEKIRLEDGRNVTVAANIADRFRGIDPEGHVVIASFETPDGEYLVGLTKCCQAAVSCDEHGDTYCKACYGEAPFHLGASTTVEIVRAS